MAQLQYFSAESVALQGCEPLGGDCGLVAQDVEVRIGSEEFRPEYDLWMLECRAKVGSIACEECGLRRLGKVRDIGVEFTVQRTTRARGDSAQPLILSIMEELPDGLATVMFCQKKSDSERTAQD